MAYDFAFTHVREWYLWRSCRAGRQSFTCCITLERRLKNADCMFACGCDHELSLPQAREQCASCATIDQLGEYVTELTSSGRGGKTGVTREAMSSLVVGIGSFDAATDAGSCAEEREVVWDVLLPTRRAFCTEKTGCANSECQGAEDSNGEAVNPRCAKVMPGFEAECDSMKKDVQAACDARLTWRHPASAGVLSKLWKARGYMKPQLARQITSAMLMSAAYGSSGTEGNAITADDLPDPPPLKPLLAEAFEEASRRAWPLFPSVAAGACAAATSGDGWCLEGACVPPFCVNFAAHGTVHDCTSDGAFLRSIFDALELLYPCFYTRADSLPAVAALDTASRGSTAEGLLCAEAADYMRPEGENATESLVPECRIDGVAPDLCTDCSSAECMEHPHFLAPVYERRKTSREVMKQAPRACVSIPRACVRLCIQRSGSG